MRQPVYFLLSAALLAAALAGCSADQPTHPTAAPAPDAETTRATPVAGSTAAIAMAPPPAAPAPRELATVKVVRSVRPPAYPVPVCGVYAGPVDSLGPDCGGVQPATEWGGANEEVEAAAASLPAYCQQALPGVQVYQLRARRDTVLVGAQGTRLLVPADAFEVPAGSGPVQLELREFYSTADIVLAGLGTRAGQALLETGGMLHLYAVANGQPVRLRAGQRIGVQLPTRQLLPGMNLYEGTSPDARHAPDWQPANPDADAGTRPSADDPLADPASLNEWVKLHPPKKPRWPEFAGGRKAMLQQIGRLLPTTKADQAYLRRKRIVGKDEQRMLKEVSRLNHTAIRQVVTLAVRLDSAGTLQQARAVAGDSLLAARVLAAVRQLPGQRPASFISTLARGRRTSSAAYGYFTVMYARSGKQLVGFQWLVMERQLREELARAGQRSRVEFARAYASASTPLTLDGGLYYELAAGGLGWINCDRLLEPGPRTLFVVETPDEATVVSLVFKDSRSILASSHQEGRTAVFEQVPENTPATVVALRRENGVTYLATSSVSLSAAACPALEFRPVSLEQLRTALAQL